MPGKTVWLIPFLTIVVLFIFAGCTPDVTMDLSGSSSDPSAFAIPPDTNSADTNGDTYNSNTTGGPWNLAWSDEFNNAGSYVPDPAVWNMEVRNDGCGNSELEYYTSRLSNIYVVNGQLVIKAIRENYYGSGYTSGRLNTKNKRTWQYGKFVARIKLPTGKGMWPAFWLLGSDYDAIGWPNCGEIDIMENKGSQPTISSGAIHFGPPWAYFAANYTLSSGNFYSSFHVFELIWTATDVKWYVDGTLFQTITKAAVTGTGRPWIFDHAFFYIINLAVGGTFDGNTDFFTTFPQYMFIDWVRVYTI